jgi:large subunit ribosomal protein L24
MSIAKIQTGDKVKVIAGNYRGTAGVVTKVVRKKLHNGTMKVRAAVNSVPKIAKYRSAQTYQGQSFPGSKFEVDRLIDISNLSLVDPSNQVSKVKIETQNGKKTRVYKKSGIQVEKQMVESTQEAPSSEENPAKSEKKNK